MNEPGIRQPSAIQRWPMTEEAWLTLVDELGQLRVDVAALAGASAPHDGVVHLPVFRAARRLDVLSAVLDASEKVHEPDRAVIGRRVTLLEEEGDVGHLRAGLSWGRRPDPRLDLRRFAPRGCRHGVQPRRHR